MNPWWILLIGMAIVLGGVLALRLHAFVALILAALVVAALTPGQHVGASVAEGFGKTAKNIGILIALAAIIGKCLLDSGAADRIVMGMTGLFGEKRSAHAFVGSGFILGIPVFFDTVFYLLMPLGKAMGMRTGRNYLLYTLAIVAGATMSHSLVPPTPGPLFVAEALNVDIGVMMLGGLAVGVLTVASGYGYATWANRRWPIPVRPSAELTEAELAEMSRHHRGADMSIWVAMLPIFLPVVLIAGGTIIEQFNLGTNSPMLLSAIKTVTEKNTALAIAAGVALATLAWTRKRAGAARDEVAKAVQSALAGGGVIILITCAGGAFGHVLNQTGIALAVEASMPTAGTSLWLLPIAFAITAVVRIAQGSATVAMITAVGVVGPIAAGAGGTLPYHPIYLALAIGCGSKPIPWMNDSGFWIISRMSGMTEGETLRTASVMMSLMGVVGLIVTMVGAWVMPLV